LLTVLQLKYECPPPGADAAEEVFKRDGKRLGNQARAKAGEIKNKAKQATKNAQKKTIRGGR
jgi:hypothetical protein